VRNDFSVLILGVAILIVSGCSRPKETQPAFKTTATVKDIMLSIVDPQADVIFNSVATIVSAAGTEERQPRTDEEWAAVRRGAVALIEATNLLLVPGRQVARSGEKSENPRIELHPETIQRLIAEDPATWARLAGALHDAAVPALKAVDARNTQGLFDAGDSIEQACEHCHQQYWYPPGHAPAWKQESER
jgi:hypothetical protein